MADLADSALVVRGGFCTAGLFEAGSGVTLDEQGRLTNVSVNAAFGVSLDRLTASIPNRQIGVCRLAEIERLSALIKVGSAAAE
ncbi:MAG: hypothetical protein ACFB2Z_12595 [Maricaulaceae bacterium]